MAMPISAVASAGASLMPSPTIATSPCCPAFSASLWMRSIHCALPSGSTLQITVSMPTWLATALAVDSVSPLSMIVRTPRALRAAMALGESGLMGSFA